MTLEPSAETILQMFNDNRCGKHFMNKGYWFVRPCEWYTGNLNNGFVALHVLIACAKYGVTAILPGHDVHHIDFGKENNHPDNLLMLTHSAHAQLHAMQRKTERYGIQANG